MEILRCSNNTEAYQSTVSLNLTHFHDSNTQGTFYAIIGKLIYKVKHDSLVNQLLTKFDGVEELNNFLIIGMTNRLDLLDEALLRPGRFEVHLEISLPVLE